MSYFEKTQILAADSPSIDSFGRWRTSGLTTIFDSKQLYDSGSLYWSTRIVGNATASFNQSMAAMLLTAAGTPSTVVRQSKRFSQYQPNKSHLAVFTGNFSGSADATIKRIGYFNENNGMFFELSGSNFGTVLRKNGTDTFVSQSSWNLDKFDGSGNSGRTINLLKSQIFFVDFEWLGVGRIRYGTFQAGSAYYVHEITNANALNNVYLSNPNLPIRYELINSGSTSQSMLHICSAVASEGGYDDTGPIRTVDNEGVVSVVAGTTTSGIVAIRLKTSGSTAFPLKISALNTSGNNNFLYSLCFNPITSSNFLWQDLTNSNIQWATGSITITNLGTKILGGYVSATSDFYDSPTATSIIGLGTDLNGYQDIFVLAVRNLGGTNQNFVGSMTFQERI